MAWTTKRRDLNLLTRYNGEIEEQKLTYLKTSEVSATQIKSAVQGLVSKLSSANYVNGEIIDTFDLNSAAASEEG